MSKNKLLTLSVCVIMIMAGCKEKKRVEKPVRPVRAIKVKARIQNESKIVLPASVNELKEVNLAFRVGGPLVELNDIVGSYVEKGDVIAQIDPRDFEIAVESAETKYIQAKAEYERYRSLFDKESVSKSLFDQMEANYKLAKASFESARNSLIDTELKAPFSGYINTVFAENFEKVNPGAPIVSLLDVSSYEVKAWIPAQDIGKINSKTEFICVIKNGETYKLKGRIREIGTKSGLTKQSYPISVLVKADQRIKIRSGMTADLELIYPCMEKNESFIVPVTSVFSKNNETCVWVFNEQTNTVSLKPIEIEEVISDKMLSIAEGLKENDYVITAGVHYLHEGQEVKLMSEFSKSNVGNQL